MAETVETPEVAAPETPLDILIAIADAVQYDPKKPPAYADFIKSVNEAARQHHSAITFDDADTSPLDGEAFLKVACYLHTPQQRNVYARSVVTFDPQRAEACIARGRSLALRGLLNLPLSEDTGGAVIEAPIAWPDGRFEAKCHSCGYIGHQLDRNSVKDFHCPKCGRVDWVPV